MIITLLMLTQTSSFATDKIVSCYGSSCALSGFAASVIDKPLFTSIDFGTNFDHIVVNVPDSQDPRSVRLNVQNNAFPGKNLTIDLSSKKSTSNSGSTVVVGDTFSNVSLTLNGYNGTSGRDVSSICADKFKNGDYGANAKTFFINRRQAQEGLNPNRCDRTDLTYLQSYNFTCDDASYHELAGTNPVVDVKRLKMKARCSGILVQDMCLKRKLIATCTYRNYTVNCGKKGGCDYSYSGDPYTFSKKYAEETYKAIRNSMSGASFCSQQMPPTSGQSYFLADGNYLTKPGVDPLTTVPMPGSDWELYYTDAYGHCGSSYTTIRTKYTAVNAYDETGTSCSQVGVAEDPNHLIPWTYTGMAQESFFGPELLHCGVGECPVQSTLSDLERYLDILSPESGTSGTQQGNGVVFAYDIQNLSSSAVIGQAGSAGQIDVESPMSTKYCGKIRDYDSDGATSDYARSPSVSFRRYRWTSIKTQSGGNNGVQPAFSDNGVKIFKKIDESVRYFLSKSLL
jgi:hypothetical protein